MCVLETDPGQCSGNFTRWSFNAESRSCQPFTWGGCQGNENRFISESACILQCDTPGKAKGLDTDKKASQLIQSLALLKRMFSEFFLFTTLVTFDEHQMVDKHHCELLTIEWSPSPNLKFLTNCDRLTYPLDFTADHNLLKG